MNERMKIYLVCQTWSNTRKNHAGIYYLCDQLSILNKDVKVINIPHFLFRGSRYLYNILYAYYALYLYFHTSNGDCVVLMEYLFSKSSDQGIIASFLKRFKPYIRIIGLPHLVGSRIKSSFSEQEIVKRISKVDSVWVLGNSLKDFFCSLGISADKIEVIFHYVDTDFYKCNYPKISRTRLKVAIMGNMMRDYDQLVTIISKLPKIDFDVCTGVNVPNVVEELESLDNVNLYSYLPEDSLKRIMDGADISLNVMKDTVGSNVIVTSMAMGLAMVVSDVGSIRDYVDNSNGLFCLTSNDFVEALLYLDKHRDEVKRMQLASITKAQEINLSKFSHWFFSSIYNN